MSHPSLKEKYTDVTMKSYFALDASNACSFLNLQGTSNGVVFPASGGKNGKLDQGEFPGEKG